MRMILRKTPLKVYSNIKVEFICRALNFSIVFVCVLSVSVWIDHVKPLERWFQNFPKQKVAV